MVLDLAKNKFRVFKIFFCSTHLRRCLLVHWSGWNCGGNDDVFNGAEKEDQMTILSGVDMMNSTMVLYRGFQLP